MRPASYSLDRRQHISHLQGAGMVVLSARVRQHATPLASASCHPARHAHSAHDSTSEHAGSTHIAWMVDSMRCSFSCSSGQGSRTLQA